MEIIAYRWKSMKSLKINEIEEIHRKSVKIIQNQCIIGKSIKKHKDLMNFYEHHIFTGLRHVLTLITHRLKTKQISVIREVY